MRAVLVVVLLVAGCGGTEYVDPVEDPKPDAGASLYPEGPYGYTVGSIIGNAEFLGRTDVDGDGQLTEADGLTTLALGDHYADPEIRAIAIDLCAIWCAPCQDEQPELVQLANDYAGSAVVLEVIQQGPDTEAADLQNLDSWAGQYDIPFDLGLDPTGQMSPYFEVAAFPSVMVIRTSDMSIQYVHVGGDHDLPAAIDAILAN